MVVTGSRRCLVIRFECSRNGTSMVASGSCAAKAEALREEVLQLQGQIEGQSGKGRW